jgi:hypothetical protein
VVPGAQSFLVHSPILHTVYHHPFVRPGLHAPRAHTSGPTQGTAALTSPRTGWPCDHASLHQEPPPPASRTQAQLLGTHVLSPSVLPGPCAPLRSAEAADLRRRLLIQSVQCPRGRRPPVGYFPSGFHAEAGVVGSKIAPCPGPAGVKASLCTSGDAAIVLPSIQRIVQDLLNPMNLFPCQISQGVRGLLSPR